MKSQQGVIQDRTIYEDVENTGANDPDLQQYNVTLQLINPGFVKTPMTDKNEFYMPFLISSEKSAKYIYNGLQTNRFEIFYPKIFGYILKVLRILPYFLLLPVLKSMLKKYSMRK